jgi:hypothetical protein
MCSIHIDESTTGVSYCAAVMSLDTLTSPPQVFEVEETPVTATV